MTAKKGPASAGPSPDLAVRQLPGPTVEQIKLAWRLLDDDAPLRDVRASWDRLVAIRRELDNAVVELARRIEQLRAEVPVQPDKKEAGDAT